MEKLYFTGGLGKWPNESADRMLQEKINEIIDWINEHEQRSPVDSKPITIGELNPPARPLGYAINRILNWIKVHSGEIANEKHPPKGDE